MVMKQCSKCKRLLNGSEFSSDVSRKDGLNIYCRKCRKQIYQDIKDTKNYKEMRKRWREKNKDHIREHGIKNCKKNKTKIKKQQRIWYIKNKPEVLKRRLQRYQDNKPEERKYMIQWLIDNPEKKRKHRRDRELKKLQLFEDFTVEEWKEKVDKTNGICQFCGKPYSDVYPFVVTIDHNPCIDKATVGYRYTIKDVIPMCGTCNTSKQTIPLNEWINTRINKKHID